MDLNKIVKEELDKMVVAAEKKYPQIEKDLEEMRKKMIKEIGDQKDVQGIFVPDTCKKVQISTVAKIIDCPLNELMLYFINKVKNGDGRRLIEYHQGLVHFYKEVE